ncbi:MAG: c-type cytochrome, partial [Pirellulales bacterium]|nr:c-type cytochrome [Pirellulales bacterium]
MSPIRQQLIGVCALTIVMVITSSLLGAVKGEPFDSVKPFLKKYCTECHGAEVQENSKRFDNLKSDLNDLETLQLWQGIVDQLNLGDMPPKDSLQPTDQEIADVVKHLTVPLQEAYASLKSTNWQTVSRRLNRFELRNTVRDL